MREDSKKEDLNKPPLPKGIPPRKPTKEALALTQQILENGSKTLRCRTKQEDQNIRNKFLTHRLPQHVDPNYYTFSDSDEVEGEEEFIIPEHSGTHKTFDPQKERNSVLRNKKQQDKSSKKRRRKGIRQVNMDFCDIDVIPTPGQDPRIAKVDMKATLRAYMHNLVSLDFTRSFSTPDNQDVYKQSDMGLLHTRSFFKHSQASSELNLLYEKYPKKEEKTKGETSGKLSKIEQIQMKSKGKQKR